MEAYPRPGITPNDLKPSFSDHIVAYRANREIVCCFYALVFKLVAINEKYPGGHRAFLEKYQGWHNEHILVVYQQGDALQEIWNDLDRYRLRKIRDWVQIDEDRVTWSWDMFNFDTQADWLKGRYKKGNVYVRYFEA